MRLLSGLRCEFHALDVACVHGGASSVNETYLPAGHCLSRAQSRHLRRSDLVIVTNDSVPVGLAAYRPADSEVRVVHQVLVSNALPLSDAVRVINALIVSLEMLACDEGVDCLMCLLHRDLIAPCFEAHGYEVIAADQCGAWVQKKLETITWARNPSGRQC